MRPLHFYNFSPADLFLLFFRSLFHPEPSTSLFVTVPPLHYLGFRECEPALAYVRPHGWRAPYWSWCDRTWNAVHRRGRQFLVPWAGIQSDIVLRERTYGLLAGGKHAKRVGWRSQERTRRGFVKGEVCSTVANYDHSDSGARGDNVHARLASVSCERGVARRRNGRGRRMMATMMRGRRTGTWKKEKAGTQRPAPQGSRASRRRARDLDSTSTSQRGLGAGYTSGTYTCITARRALVGERARGAGWGSGG